MVWIEWEGGMLETGARGASAHADAGGPRLLLLLWLGDMLHLLWSPWPWGHGDGHGLLVLVLVHCGRTS